MTFPEITIKAEVSGRGEQLNSSADVARLFDCDADRYLREKFMAVYLDMKHRIIGYHVVSVGSLTQAQVQPREVFRPAMLLPCQAIVFLHNHPSGDPAPSAQDLNITRRLNEAAQVLGIKVLDHVMVGEDGHYSFADHGLL